MNETFEMVFRLVLAAVQGGLIGAERIENFMASAGVLQIFAAGLIGMIPNCASSVLLTQMYAAGQLSFAAMFAGLCSGSGIGSLVLLRTIKNKRRAVLILALVYLAGVLFGLLAAALPL